MMKIGFIGVGNMGRPMARNLHAAGYQVAVHDVSAENLRLCAADGLSVPGSMLDTVRDADVVITMLPAGQHVRHVYAESDEAVLTHVGPQTLLIDCSTIDVATSREVAAMADSRGLSMIDAPVSGGIGGAEAGTLAFMVGGAEQAVENARALFDVMGKTMVHVGDAGAGQAAKICNNMLLGISMIGVSEAFTLADNLGLDRQKLFDVCANSSGQCWSLTTYCPVPGPVPTSPANRDYQAGFTVAMMLKDLKLARDAATESSTDTQMGELACSLYEQFAKNGHEGLDFSGIIRLVGEN